MATRRAGCTRLRHDVARQQRDDSHRHLKPLRREEGGHAGLVRQQSNPRLKSAGHHGAARAAARHRRRRRTALQRGAAQRARRQRCRARSSSGGQPHGPGSHSPLGGARRRGRRSRNSSRPAQRQRRHRVGWRGATIGASYGVARQIADVVFSQPPRLHATVLRRGTGSSQLAAPQRGRRDAGGGDRGNRAAPPSARGAALPDGRARKPDYPAAARAL